jgi:predicted DCC family thiol-disulfide oxidoreductase YuxK
MFGLKYISRWQFGLMRIALGTYLLFHFGALLPYAGELFSSAGTLGDSSLSPFFRILPSPFWISDLPITVSSLLLLACVGSVSLILGRRRKLWASILLYIWACLFCRNPLIANPSMGYVGLILLLTLLVPNHEALRSGQSEAQKWYFPSGVYWVAWILLAVGYTFSGLIKLQSPSWMDGTALLHLAENPLARPGFMRDGLLLLPMGVLKLMTWGSLLGEILFLPLSLSRHGRCIIWTVMVCMHLGILMVVDFFDLTAAMLLIHLFTFDPEWFPAKKRTGKRILFYDGDCGLCTNSVKFFMEEDREKLIQFAPLQGETARVLLPAELRDASQLSTVVLYRQKNDAESAEIILRSNAIFTALNDIGGFWRVPAWIGRLIPNKLRDIGYNFIARYRLKIFPKGACSLPTSDERARLLP